jgi:hypothetical protein
MLAWSRFDSCASPKAPGRSDLPDGGGCVDRELLILSRDCVWIMALPLRAVVAFGTGAPVGSGAGTWGMVVPTS